MATAADYLIRTVDCAKPSVPEVQTRTPTEMEQNRAKSGEYFTKGLKTHKLQNHHVRAWHHKNTLGNTAVTANSYY